MDAGVIRGVRVWISDAPLRWRPRPGPPIAVHYWSAYNHVVKRNGRPEDNRLMELCGVTVSACAFCPSRRRRACLNELCYGR